MFPNTSLLTDAREKLLKLEDTVDILRKGAKYIYIYIFLEAETRFMRLGHLNYLSLAGQVIQFSFHLSVEVYSFFKQKI